MLAELIEKKMRTAHYKKLKDGSYFGEIPKAKGVWANANNLEDCRNELREVLEDWLLLQIRSGKNIPGFKIVIGRRMLVKNA
jgi:predicted RNase H-like HicB family nuclease